MSKQNGVDSQAVIQKLKALAAKNEGHEEVSYVVGYTQNYAIYVHENMEAYHSVGQAKFLEQPAREKKTEIADVIHKTYEKTNDLDASVLRAALFLQRLSQQLVPVDTGALKNSAFTQKDSQ